MNRVLQVALGVSGTTPERRCPVLELGDLIKCGMRNLKGKVRSRGPDIGRDRRPIHSAFHTPHLLTRLGPACGCPATWPGRVVSMRPPVRFTDWRWNPPSGGL